MIREAREALLPRDVAPGMPIITSWKGNHKAGVVESVEAGIINVRIYTPYGQSFTIPRHTVYRSMEGRPREFGRMARSGQSGLGENTGQEVIS